MYIRICYNNTAKGHEQMVLHIARFYVVTPKCIEIQYIHIYTVYIQYIYSIYICPVRSTVCLLKAKQTVRPIVLETASKSPSSIIAQAPNTRSQFSRLG